MDKGIEQAARVWWSAHYEDGLSDRECARAAVLAFIDANMDASEDMVGAGENVMCCDPHCECNPKPIWQEMLKALRERCSGGGG